MFSSRSPRRVSECHPKSASLLAQRESALYAPSVADGLEGIATDINLRSPPGMAFGSPREVIDRENEPSLRAGAPRNALFGDGWPGSLAHR